MSQRQDGPSERMKSWLLRLYVALVLVSLVALAAWTAYSWSTIQKESVDRNYAQMRLVAGKLTEVGIRYKNVPEAALTSLFRKYLLSDPRWKVLTFSSQEQGVLYYYGPKVDGIPSPRSSERFAASVAWKPQFLEDYLLQTRVYLPNDQTYVLQGIYHFYGRSEIFDALKLAGFVLVGLLVLTCLLLLVGALSRSTPLEDEPISPSADDAPQPSVRPSLHDLETETLANLPQLRNDELAPERDEFWFDDHHAPASQTHPAEESPEPVATAEVSTNKPASSDDPDLFSPRSGLSWESFLERRLTFELERTASQNQDLCLVLWQGKGLENANVYKSVGQELTTSFPYKDLDFEYGSSGFAVVVPHQSLEKTLKDAEEFLRRIDRTLPQSFLSAGVASRSGRLLSAKVLVQEAEAALKRSRSGNQRIVGLKTDPDRYRAYLQNNAQA